jgi:hypothetical protein
MSAAAWITNRVRGKTPYSEQLLCTIKRELDAPIPNFRKIRELIDAYFPKSDDVLKSIPEESDNNDEVPDLVNNNDMHSGDDNPPKLCPLFSRRGREDDNPPELFNVEEELENVI